MKTIAIVGDREYTNYSEFANMIDSLFSERDYTPSNVKIISGDARGADSLAKKYASENKYTFFAFKAHWEVYGKSAGPKRNAEIVKNADIIIAFKSPSSVGTVDTIRKGKENRKEVIIVELS